MSRSLVFCVLICFITVHTSAALFEWLFGEKGSESTIKDGAITATDLKFEVHATDHKFLQLKDALDNLTPLDACYHIVVYSLKKKCGDLSEEALGKLSVNLLNCQSAAEERPTYTCTDTMTLAECTRDMDPTTWNSYHIVSNRARSLCYATQQNQFRRLAEVTVNQLVNSAHGQLEYLKQLQTGQEQLHLLTTDTVRKLYDSQVDMLGNQQSLHTAQDNQLQQIHDNMVQLKQEKAMITTGNTELAKLTENIRLKLDEATSQLQRQELSQMESHGKILEDLTSIQHKSHDALDKLDESSRYLLKNHGEMLDHYATMYENMMRINNTVSHLLYTVNTMQKHLDDKINWFSYLLNMADDKLSLLTCGAVHIGYFLFAALAASFLQTPAFTRIILFLLVSLNATMEIQCGQSLDLTHISVLMIFICIVNWIFLWWHRRHQNHMAHQTTSNPLPLIGSLLSNEESHNSEGENRNQSTATGGTPLTTPLSPTEMRHLSININRLYQSLNESQHSGGDNSFTVPSARGHNFTVPSSRGHNSSVPSSRGHNSSLQEPTVSSHEPRASTSAFTPVYRSRPEVASPDSSTVDHIAKVNRYLENLDEDTSLGADLDTHDTSTPVLHRRRTPHRPSSRSSSSTNKSFCHGYTKAGGACRLSSPAGMEYCHRHRDQASS